MTTGGAGIGNPYERELQYYRRECNDLGARLLRLQEEQSQAFREARRSRTVVKLVREAYRLGDPAQTAHDVGGPVLEVIVDNLLCDRAVLLREEPLGSGRFLVAHAIGRPDTVGNTIKVRNPPAFFYTAGHTHDLAPDGLLDVLGLPYALWAYDPSSGHALVVGNRLEGNVSRPFEAGDQELIEGALSIYLDVLYRKHAEAQLRQAKQAAEEAGQAKMGDLETLSREVRSPLQTITALSEAMASQLVPVDGLEWFRDGARQIAACSAQLAALTEDMTRLADSGQEAPMLDVEWVALDEVLGAALQSVHVSDQRRRVRLSTGLPQRRFIVCVDRTLLQKAIRILVGGAVARAEPGSRVRLDAGRRSDGALEIVVSVPTEELSALSSPEQPSAEQNDAAPREIGPADGRTEDVRRIISAHGGILVTDTRPSGGTQIRVILPAHGVREDDLASAAAY